MSRALKALLMSALIIPGAGHFYLRRFKSGMVFLLLSGVSLTIIITHLANLAHQVLDQVNAGKISLNATAIRQALNGQLALQSPALVTIAWGILITAFLVCLADAYRIGKKQQLEVDDLAAKELDRD